MSRYSWGLFSCSCKAFVSVLGFGLCAHVTATQVQGKEVKKI